MTKECKDGYILVEKYKIITEEKAESLDSVLTLKEALDLWWNRVDFEIDGKRYYGYKQIYDGKYYVENSDDGVQIKGDNLKKLLSTTIKLDKGWEMDSDGYPYITAEIVQKQQKLM